MMSSLETSKEEQSTLANKKEKEASLRLRNKVLYSWFENSNLKADPPITICSISLICSFEVSVELLYVIQDSVVSSAWCLIPSATVRMWTLGLLALSQDVAMASAYFLDYSVSAAVGGFAHSLFNRSWLSQKSSSVAFKLLMVEIVLNSLSGVLGRRRNLGAAILLALKN